MEKLIKKTAIQIIPNPQEGKDGYVIICRDEKACADFFAGKDNNPVAAFDVQSQGGKIASVLIELDDGVPTLVTTREE